MKTLDGIGPWNEGLQKFEIHPLDFDRSTYTNSPLIGTGAVGIEDSNGKLWFGGAWNLVRYDPFQKSIEYSLRSEYDKTGDPFRINCRSILEDESGILWIGDNGRGLYKYAPKENLFYNSEHKSEVFTHSTRAIHEDFEGRIWFADNSRLFVWDRKKEVPPQLITLDSKKYSRLFKEQFSNVFSILESHDKSIWVGCKYRLFQLFTREGEITDFNLYDFSETEESIFDLHEDSNGDLWLITNSSFGRFDKETGQFDRNNFSRKGDTQTELLGSSCIHHARNGVFWLGTVYGLLKFNRSDGSFEYFNNDPLDKSSISHDIVNTICPDPLDPEKILWVGTGGGGINKFDKTTKKFQHFRVEDGPPQTTSSTACFLMKTICYGLVPTGDYQDLILLKATLTIILSQMV